MRCLKSRLALLCLQPAWAVSLAIGVALGVWLYLLAVSTQLNDVANSLEDDCRERGVAIQTSIDALRSASLSMSAVVGSHPLYGITQAIFSQFVSLSSSVTIRTALTRVTWLQRVYQHERATWEARMSAQFGTNITILEVLTNASVTIVGNRRVSPIKPVYFPITYPAGFENATLRGQSPTVLVGVDLLTAFDQPWGWIFNEVINSSAELVTLPVAVADRGNIRCTIAVYNISQPSVEQRQSHALGTIIMFINLTETLNLALAPFVSSTDMRFTVIDQVSLNSSTPTVAATTAADRPQTLMYEMGAADGDASDKVGPYASVITYGGRDWTLTCTPTSSYVKRRTTYTPVAYLCGLLAMGILLALLFRRITAITSMALQLSDATSQTTQFLSFICHEIRNPLHAIVGMNALLGEHDLTQEQRECVQSIASSSQLMAAIVNDVLDLNKIQAGKLTLTPVPFDLHDMIKDLQEVYHLSLEAKTVNWTTSIGVGVPRIVVGDSTRLRQMLANLISNAFKFTRQGSICLSLEVVNDPTQLHQHHHYRRQAHQLNGVHHKEKAGLHHVRDTTGHAYEGEGELVLIDFKVTDTGMGISPTLLKDLFKPYSHAHSLSDFGGTGLGLSIVQLLAEAMGGNVRAESELGHGSCFAFRLAMPRVDSASVADAATAHSPLMAASGIPSFTHARESTSTASSAPSTTATRPPGIAMSVLTGGNSSAEAISPPSSTSNSTILTRAGVLAAASSAPSSSSSGLVVVRPQSSSLDGMQSPPHPIRWHMDDSSHHGRGSGSTLTGSPGEGAPSVVALSIAMAPSGTAVALQAATAAARLRAVDRNAQLHGSNDSLDSRHSHSHSSSGDGKFGGPGSLGELMPSIMEAPIPGTEPKTMTTTTTTLTTTTTSNNNNNSNPNTSRSKNGDSGELALPEGFPLMLTITSTASSANNTTDTSGPPSPDPPWRQLARHTLLNANNSNSHMTNHISNSGSSTSTSSSSSSAPLPRRMLSPMGGSISRVGTLPPLLVSPRRPPSSTSSAASNGAPPFGLVGVIPEAYSPQHVASSLSSSASGSLSPAYPSSSLLTLPPINTTAPAILTNMASSSSSASASPIDAGASPASASGTMLALTGPSLNTSPVPTPSSTPHATNHRLSPFQPGGGGTSGSDGPRSANTSPTPSPMTPSNSLFMPIRVLLVEDNLVNRKLGLRILAVPGITADWAIDGIDALEKCGCGDVSHLIAKDGLSPPPSAQSQSSSPGSSSSAASGGWMAAINDQATLATQLAIAPQRYDLILMDVEMPRMNGIKCTRELRARGLTTPIVALTANAMAEQRAACLAAGCTDFVTKPFEPEALRVLIATLANVRLRSDVDPDHITASPASTISSAAATPVAATPASTISSHHSNSGTRIDDDTDREASLRALRVRQLVASWAKPVRTTATRVPAKADSKAQ